MLKIEVKKLTKVMTWVRGISFIVYSLALAFFVIIGFKGVEIEMTDAGIVAIMLVPALILFASGRWWESLTGKKFIGLSIKKESGYKDDKKSGHVVVKKDAYAVEIIQI
jgi:hypothetical protein